MENLYLDRQQPMRAPAAILTMTAALFSCYAFSFYAEPQTKQVRIEFVGCAADGQAGPIDPPKGTPKVVTLEGVAAEEIAYYKGEQAPGVFAPRGWDCHAWYGSGGSTLVVSPVRIASPYFSNPEFRDEAVEVSLIQGGTSGRHEVAAYASHFFPGADAKFVKDIEALRDEPPSQAERERFAADSVKTISSVAIEFTTPPDKTGLGTGRYLVPSIDPIDGIAVLDSSDPDEPNLSIVRVRLRPVSDRLKAALLQLNLECMLKRGGC